MTGDLEAARRVKDQLVEQLSADTRLRGIGLSPQPDALGSYAVVVRVTEVAYAQELGLPTTVDGVVVEVSAVGDVVALGPESSAEELTRGEPAEGQTEPPPGDAVSAG